jgi:hypothetical protein
MARFVDRVFFAREVFHRETHGDGLLCHRIGAFERVRLSSLVARFCSDHMLDPRELEQVTERRCVDEVGGFDHRVAFRLQPSNDDTDDMIAVRPRRNRTVQMHDAQTPVDLVGCRHLLQHRDGNARIVAKPTHPSIAGIQQRARTRLGRERYVAAIEIANTKTQRAIRSRGPELLDPTMLVGWDCLVRQLPADPPGFFRQDHTLTEPRGCERCGTSTEATPDDRDVGS